MERAPFLPVPGMILEGRLGDGDLEGRLLRRCERCASWKLAALARRYLRWTTDRETEAIAMRVAMDYEREAGREPTDVSVEKLGYDITSLDHSSGELRLKGLAVAALSGPDRR